MNELRQWMIAVGASGSYGLQDLRALLSTLPKGFPGSVLVAAHQPADRVSFLREFLASGSRLPVSLAREEERFEPGRCYLGEPCAHLTVGPDGRAHLVTDAHNAFRNRTIDLLFSSLALAGPSRMIGVALSRSLEDGRQGLATIQEAGGLAMSRTPRDQGGRSPEHRDLGGFDFVGGARDIAREIENIVTAARMAPATVLDEQRQSA